MSERTFGCFSLFLIFSFRSHTSPDMAFLFIFVQYFPDLQVQRIIALPQTLGQGFMHGGFGNAKLFCCRADSGAGFDHVHSQFTGARF